MIVLSNLFRRVMQYMIWGLPGFGSFDPKRSAQIMDLCEIDVANVVGTVVGSNLSACPVKAFDPEFRARLEGFHHRNVRVPTIVGLYLCRFGGRLEIGVKGNFGHHSLLPTMLQIGATRLRAICRDSNELGQLPPRGADLSQRCPPARRPSCLRGGGWKLREKL